MFIFLLLLFFIPPVEAESLSSLQRAEADLIHAQTWYDLAQATENSMRAHENSKLHYQQALRHIDGMSSGPAEGLRLKAKSGLSQVETRIDNSHDTFRNVYEPIWWISEQDATVERHDDIYMKAFENAGNALSAHLSKSVYRNRIPVIVRAHRSGHLPKLNLYNEDEASRSNLFRDEAISYFNAQSKTYGLTDDRGVSLLGEMWSSLVQNRAPLSTLQRKRLMSELSSSKIILADVAIADEIPATSEHANLVRLHLNYQVVDLATGEVEYQASFKGLGRDTVTSFFWPFLLFFIAIAMVFVRARMSRASNQHPEADGIDAESKSTFHDKAIVLGFAAFILGAVTSIFAGELSMQFLQDWGSLAYLWEADSQQWGVPYPPAMLWPLVHGAVVMIGPLLLLVIGSVKLNAYLHQWFKNPSQQFAIIGPAAQAGAVTFLFYPLVSGLPTEGWIIALPLSLVAIFGSLVIVGPILEILEGKATVVTDYFAIVVALLALLMLLPFGLLKGFVWPTAIVASVLVFWSNRQFSRLKNHCEEVVQEQEEGLPLPKGVSIEHPLWVPVFDLSQALTVLEKERFLEIKGPSRIGLTRVVAEISSKLDPEKRLFVAADPIDESGPKPFSLIKNLFVSLGINLDLQAQEERVERAKEALATVEESLLGWSILGAMVGALPEGSEDGRAYQRSRIIETGAKALHVKWIEKGKEILVIEDCQWIDTSSVEVLERFFEMMSTPPQVLFAWKSSAEEGPSTAAVRQLLDKSKAHEMILKEFNNDHAKQFVAHCGIRGLSDEVVTALNQTASGCAGTLRQFLLAMRDSQLILPPDSDNQAGTLVSVPDLDLKTIWQKLPKEAKEAERKRLYGLSSEQRLILDCAALCGTQFYLDEIAAAVGWDRMHTARVLQELETQISPPIIRDIPSQDGVFEFSNSLTVEALKVASLFAKSSKHREFAKAMHSRVLDGGGGSNSVPTSRLYHHAHFAGDKRRSDLLRIAADLLDERARQRAWPEMLFLVDEIKKSRSVNDDYVIAARLDLAAARAHRYTGGQGSREKAMGLLQNRIGTVLNQETTLKLAFEVCFTWCEVCYEEKTKTEIDALNRACVAYEERCHTPLLRAVFSFYRALTSGPDKLPALLSITQTISHLAECPEQQFLLSCVLQEHANQWWQQLSRNKALSDREKQDNWEAKILPLLDRAKALKEKTHDFQGLAINLGTRGNVALYFLKDYKAARQWLQQDYEMLQANGIESDVSSLLNRLSMVDHEEAKLEEDPSEANRLYDDAHRRAHEAFEMAKRLEREGDLAFSGIQCLTLLLEHPSGLSNQIHTDLDAIGQVMADPVLWQEIKSPYIKREFMKRIVSVRERVGSRDWLQTALDSISAASIEEGLSLTKAHGLQTKPVKDLEQGFTQIGAILSDQNLWKNNQNQASKDACLQLIVDAEAALGEQDWMGGCREVILSSKPL